jgi:hypothetical protein
LCAVRQRKRALQKASRNLPRTGAQKLVISAAIGFNLEATSNDSGLSRLSEVIQKGYVGLVGAW